jgi:hypothetical protein
MVKGALVITLPSFVSARCFLKQKPEKPHGQLGWAAIIAIGDWFAWQGFVFRYPVEIVPVLGGRSNSLKVLGGSEVLWKINWRERAQKSLRPATSQSNFRVSLVILIAR